MVSRKTAHANGYERNRDQLYDAGVLSDPAELRQWHDYVDELAACPSESPTLTLRKDFHDLIPALSEDEYRQLEANLKAEGCRDALVVWPKDGQLILVDGHNRYRICRREGIAYRVVERAFEDELQAMLWMIQNQRSRRNLNDYQRDLQALKEKELLEKIARQNQRGGQGGVLLSSDLKKANSWKEAAENNDTSVGSMHKVQFIEENAPEFIREKARRNDLTRSRAYELTKALSIAAPVVRAAAEELELDDPRVIAAWQTAHQQNPKFVEETLERGHITNLDGEDIPLAQADATLIEAITAEDHYERIRRQETYVKGSREKKREREAQKAQQRLEAAQIAGGATEDSFRLYCGDFTQQAAQLADGSVDAVITDPPYGYEYLHLYQKLALLAARVLKDGGSLITLSGQSYLPEVMALLSSAEGLRYQWMLSYLTPGGQSAHLWRRKVNTFWKPALWYVKGAYGGSWIGDVVQSPVNGNDKRFHAWGQNEVAMAQLLERVSVPGDWILDPMCGACTTGVAALKLGRKFIGMDLDEQSIQIGRERLLSCIGLM